MVDIYSLIGRAQKLREETRLDSVSPDRVGALCEDTLKYINEFQLLASAPSLHKIYASVSAMQSDSAPKSDLTGKALKPGQLAVIVPADQTDATAGDVYRYDGPSGNTSAWTFVAKIGGVPADAELNASSTNPVQNKAVTEKLTELSDEIGAYSVEEFVTGGSTGIVPFTFAKNVTEFSLTCNTDVKKWFYLQVMYYDSTSYTFLDGYKEWGVGINHNITTDNPIKALRVYIPSAEEGVIKLNVQIAISSRLAELENITQEIVSKLPDYDKSISENIFLTTPSNIYASRLVELYLTGLDSSQSYQIKRLNRDASGSRMQIYIGDSANTTVAMFEASIKSGIIKLNQYKNSGIEGYAIVKLSAEDIDYESNIFINNSIVMDLSYSPSIKAMLTDARIADIEEDVTVLDSKIDSEKRNSYAATWIAENRLRERMLRDKYQEKIANGGKATWYGFQYAEIEDSSNGERIASDGDMNLHASLPIQNKMRRCITKDRVVQYYLDANDSSKKEDGTSANLDGTDGDVMVEIPEFFYKVEESNASGVRVVKMMISEDGMPGWEFSPRRYTSAFEMTIDHDNEIPVSVKTTNFNYKNEEVKIANSQDYSVSENGQSLGVQKTCEVIGYTSNAARYRGITNDAQYDNENDPSSHFYTKNQLGRPICNVNRKEIESIMPDHYFIFQYDTQRILNMLCLIEYGTRNIQTPIAEKDDNGYTQGGLGMGATTFIKGYAAYELFYSADDVRGGLGQIPCGITTILGNNSGEVYYKLRNVPTTTSNDNSYKPSEVTFGGWSDVWIPCMSYRGIEHFYGHIYKIATQVNLYRERTKRYVAGHDGDGLYEYQKIAYYYQRNPYLATLEIKDDELLWEGEFVSDQKPISKLLLGKHGHILPIDSDVTTGLYSKNYCDMVEFNDGRYNYITFNGRLVSSVLVGLWFIVSQDKLDGTTRRSSDGSRLEHF